MRSSRYTSTYSRRTSSGVWRSASVSISSRQAQKSRPPVRPRSARWKAWQWASTKPGRLRVSAMGVSFPHPMATRAVPAPLQQLPNALTLARLVLIPVFVALMLTAEGGHSWPAGIVFGVAGVTDQIDGFLARRWRVESEFGRIFDPLADRLMIDAAVILLYIADHMPLAGLVLILGRDVVLMIGYKTVAPEGYELRVNLLGKIATWLL